jgi:diguanylate cyclase (GGDEF)-like protein/PAS domain S-box-containing protein
VRVRANGERYRSLFDNHPDPTLAIDTGGGVTRANAAVGRVLGMTPDEFVGLTIGDVVGAADFPLCLATFNRALHGLAGGVDLGIRHPKAGTIPAHVIMVPIAHGDAVTGVHMQIRDLRARLAHVTQATTHAEGIRDLYLSAASSENAERQIAATLEAGCRILGLGSGALFEAASNSIVQGTGDPIPTALAQSVVGADEPVALETLPPSEVPSEASFAALIGTSIDVAGERYGSLCFAANRWRPHAFNDADRDFIRMMGALVAAALERARDRARLRTLAYSDVVTALPNRAWLVERLRDELVQAQTTGGSIGVLFLDLDGFKSVNDVLGHASGDRLLRIIGERLTRAVRGGDVVVRMGSDEFVVLAFNAPDPAVLGSLAERMIVTVAEPVEIEGQAYAVTTSIGIALFPADGTQAETLVEHADVAMYRAKERGRNTYQFFTPVLGSAARFRRTQEKSLEQSIERDAFVVHYQPQHDLRDGSVVAVEALVRWDHPRHGLILPATFLPAAERSGLIVPIGDAVLERACADLARWRATLSPRLRVALNLSARQMRRPGLAGVVRDALARHGIPPDALEFEIAEPVAMADAAITLGVMKELRAVGVRLVIDDFGTGFSSLEYLRRFPVEAIKIDGSYVDGLNRERDDATIVRAAIAMAHALERAVVAEAVEERDQVEILRAAGCDRVQGHVFSPALPGAALERYLAGHPAAFAAG